MMRIPRRVISVCGLGVLACFAYFGFTPFEFSPVNRVSWNRGEGGLYFEGTEGRGPHPVGGIAVSAPLRTRDGGPPAGDGAIAVSILLRPAVEPSSELPHFFALADAGGREILYLGQWKETLIVGWFTAGAHGRRIRDEVGMSGALRRQAVSRLTVSSDQAGTTLYQEGREPRRIPGKRLLRPGDSLRGKHIVLGNSPDVGDPWTGSILEVSVAEEALAPAGPGLVARFDLRGGPAPVVFDSSGNGNSLLVPDRIHAESHWLEWEAPSSYLTWSLISDVALNILGFMVFGFVFALWMAGGGKRPAAAAYLYVFLLGAAVSFAIETIQVLIPARSSDLRDLICNIFGTALGILGYHLLRRRIGLKPAADRPVA